MRSTIQTVNAATAEPLIRRRSTPKRPQMRADLAGRVDRRRSRRLWSAIPVVSLLALLATSLAVGSATAGRDDAPGRDANHCVNAFGVDLNELYDVSDQFRNRDCQAVTAGDHWVLGPLVWIVDDGVDSLYPDGYVPVAPNPVDDFAAKLVAVKVVVDGKTQVFSPGEVLRTDITPEQLEPGSFEDLLALASMLPRLRPMSAGEHTFQPFIVLSAMHCDGIAPDEDSNCLPAGEIPFAPLRPITVTTP